MRSWILSVATLTAACASTSYSRPPDAPVASAETAHVSDVVRYRVPFDDVLGGDLLVGANGELNFPGCDAQVRVAGRDLHAIEEDAGRCLVAGGLYERAPALRVWFARRAPDVQVIIEDPPTGRAFVSSQVGTLLGALSATASGPPPDAVMLARAGRAYRIHVHAILHGEAADVPLAPGDAIVIDELKTVKPQAPVSPPRDPPVDTPRFDVGGATCGQLVLRRARLKFLHFGPNHPELGAVNKGILRTCAADHPLESVLAACDEVRRDLSEAEARGLGANHPDVQMLTAELGPCPR